MGLDRNPAANALYRTDPLRFFRRHATCETNDAINGHKTAHAHALLRRLFKLSALCHRAMRLDSL